MCARTLKGNMQSNFPYRPPLSDNGPFFLPGGQKNTHIESCLKPVYKRPLPSVPKMAVVEKFNCEHFRIQMNRSWLVPKCLSGFSTVARRKHHVIKSKGTTAERSAWVQIRIDQR